MIIFHRKICLTDKLIEIKMIYVKYQCKRKFLQNDVLVVVAMKNLATLAFVPRQNVIEEFIRIKKNISIRSSRLVKI